MISSNRAEPEVLDSSFALPLPTFVPRRYRPGSLANWSGHLAFANDLIAECRPSLLAELGTHHGESYFGMCQSVLGNGVDCVCYAVDHWLGEEHAGYYGEEVFTEVNDYNSRFYKSFSYLLRSSFDDALTQFEDNTIDLLHIDGLHTYEAGSHDFFSWFPKVSPGGIVLLHDVVVRHANFGIWKLWDELKNEFAEAFTFHHSWGLGVLRKAGAESTRPKLLDLLFSHSAKTREQVRRHYVLYSSYLEQLLARGDEPVQLAKASAAPAAKKALDGAFFQVFLPVDGTYSESVSLQRGLEPGEWRKLEFELPSGVSGAIRLDPCDRPCVLEIGSIDLVDPQGGVSVWGAHTAPALKALQLSHSASLLPSEEACLILSYGYDPQIFLPPLQHGGSLRLEVSVRLDRDFQILLQALEQEGAPTSAQALRADASTGNPTVRVYPFRTGGYVEADSVAMQAKIGHWSTLTFEFGPGSLMGPFRLDPPNTPCLFEIGKLEVFNVSTGKPILRLSEAWELRQFTIINSAMYLPPSDRCLLFCFGNDSKLQFAPNLSITDAVRIEISAKVEVDLARVAALLSQEPGEGTGTGRAKLSADFETVKAELKASQSCRLLLAAELSQLAMQKDSIIREKDDALKRAAGDRERLEELLETANETLARREVAFAEVAAALSRERDVLRAVEGSVSWRLTKPIRDVMQVVRGRRP